MRKKGIVDVKTVIKTVAVVLVLVAIIVVGVVFLTKMLTGKNDESENKGGNSNNNNPDKPAVLNEKIDLQLAVDQWLTKQPDANNSGIVIYDLDNNEIVGRHLEDTAFRIESIYKMFVAYEGYYRIDHDIWKATDVYPIARDYKGNPYTRKLCLDHMVRFSYSPCAEVMWGEIKHDQLQNIYNEKGFKNTSIQGLTSTASDLTKLYQMFWNHTDLSESSWEQIQDSMINQVAPASAGAAYAQKWRQGLPSGFTKAKVYNKVGWLGDGNGHWIYYDDAAFVVMPEAEDKDTGLKHPERHYIVIALTKNTAPSQLVLLGRNIESAIRTADNY